MHNNLKQGLLELNSCFQEARHYTENTDLVCRIGGEVLVSTSIIVDRFGLVLGSWGIERVGSAFNIRYFDGSHYFSTEDVSKLSSYKDTVINGSFESAQAMFLLFPIVIAGSRKATFIFTRMKNEYSEEEIYFAQICRTYITLFLNYIHQEDEVKKINDKSAVKVAVSNLSYSELEAAIYVLNELDGTEGLLVASKIADKVDITRSVIVSALKKLEAAGVVESRSLGMKGTFIKITNPYLLAELN